MLSRATLTSLSLALLMSGCASTLVGNDVIVQRTAFALGVSAADITISNRGDEGGSTRYQARTRSGQEFNCSLGVVVSVLGRQVTDAVCNKKGEPPRNPLLR
ncbi:hypothetical protein HNQ51_000029 [Inhella inkyongensis]|uniref:Lipoprotein n=1 Tax=Inhella inkyongensis TaxID=392593 RepID=A0A840S0Y5_9BURK|nr:hypothetical protein [Inhella inkyongensis]MBB5202736.1 hypothetical protein [Inhella inkyongensis]